MYFANDFDTHEMNV